jgi:hypothetical protein
MKVMLYFLTGRSCRIGMLDVASVSVLVPTSEALGVFSPDPCA